MLFMNKFLDIILNIWSSGEINTTYVRVDDKEFKALDKFYNNHVEVTKAAKMGVCPTSEQKLHAEDVLKEKQAELSTAYKDFQEYKKKNITQTQKWQFLEKEVFELKAKCRALELLEANKYWNKNSGPILVVEQGFPSFRRIGETLKHVNVLGNAGRVAGGLGFGAAIALNQKYQKSEKKDHDNELHDLWD